MRVGFCNGCFDAFHPGHRFFLIEAAKQCDYLIVAVNSDESVRALKGAGRPLDSLERRLSRPSAYAEAAIPFGGNVLPLLEAIRPDVIIRGADQSDEGVCIAPIVRIRRLPGYSTTSIAATLGTTLEKFAKCPICASHYAPLARCACGKNPPTSSDEDVKT